MFAWSVIKCFEKPMLRQLTEAVIINSANDNEITNLNTEYCSNNINGIRKPIDIQANDKPILKPYKNIKNKRSTYF